MPPRRSSYRLIAASSAVRQCLNDAGIAVDDAPVIYPGARVDLLGQGSLDGHYLQLRMEPRDDR